ncbi:MAG: hypothetical protein SFX73_01820 [Kofleriaceae bacterium]|nr:hypothetical protein [Kofleriaceae bacterium]
MKRFLLVALAACGAKSTSTPSTTSGPTGGAPSTGSWMRPSGPTELKRGDSHQVEINARETHDWFIDLAAGEKITFDIAATSTGATKCSNWSWGFFNPAGGTLVEKPQLPVESGQWADSIPGVAEASIVEGPTAGRYTVKVRADEWCPQLHYTLSAK